MFNSKPFLILLGISTVLGQRSDGQFYPCNPTKNATGSCMPNKGSLSSTYSIDFTKTKSLPPEWILSNYATVSFGSNGAEFTFNKRGDSPQIWTNFYMLGAKYEIEMQIAPGAGMISSSVLISDTWDELDLEFSGNNFNFTGDGYGQNNWFGKGVTGSWDRGSWFPVSQPQKTFHTYGVDWNQQRTIWSVDGSAVRTVNAADCKDVAHQYPQSPSKLQIGIWDAGDPDMNYGTVQWAGGYTNLKEAPFTMYVRRLTITNYTPACAYNFTDQSGSWGSIKAITDQNVCNKVFGTSTTSITSTSSKISSIVSSASAVMSSFSTKSSSTASPATSSKPQQSSTFSATPTSSIMSSLKPGVSQGAAAQSSSSSAMASGASTSSIHYRSTVTVLGAPSTSTVWVAVTVGGSPVSPSTSKSSSPVTQSPTSKASSSTTPSSSSTVRPATSSMGVPSLSKQLSSTTISTSTSTRPSSNVALTVTTSSSSLKITTTSASSVSIKPVATSSTAASASTSSSPRVSSSSTSTSSVNTWTGKAMAGDPVLVSVASKSTGSSGSSSSISISTWTGKPMAGDPVLFNAPTTATSKLASSSITSNVNTMTGKPMAGDPVLASNVPKSSGSISSGPYAVTFSKSSITGTSSDKGVSPPFLSFSSISSSTSKGISIASTSTVTINTWTNKAMAGDPVLINVPNTRSFTSSYNAYTTSTATKISAASSLTAGAAGNTKGSTAAYSIPAPEQGSTTSHTVSAVTQSSSPVVQTSSKTLSSSTNTWTGKPMAGDPVLYYPPTTTMSSASSVAVSSSILKPIATSSVGSNIFAAAQQQAMHMDLSSSVSTVTIRSTSTVRITAVVMSVLTAPQTSSLVVASNQGYVAYSDSAGPASSIVAAAPAAAGTSNLQVSSAGSTAQDSAIPASTPIMPAPNYYETQSGTPVMAPPNYYETASPAAAVPSTQSGTPKMAPPKYYETRAPSSAASSTPSATSTGPATATASQQKQTTLSISSFRALFQYLLSVIEEVMNRRAAAGDGAGTNTQVTGNNAAAGTETATADPGFRAVQSEVADVLRKLVPRAERFRKHRREAHVRRRRWV